MSCAPPVYPGIANPGAQQPVVGDLPDAKLLVDKHRSSTSGFRSLVRCHYEMPLGTSTLIRKRSPTKRAAHANGSVIGS